MCISHNGLGEHIDYSGYSVLPMAIERDTIMAVGYQYEDSQPATVELVNVNEKYPKRQFNHEPGVHTTIDASGLEWSNYFKCGYKVQDSFGNSTGSVGCSQS